MLNEFNELLTVKDIMKIFNISRPTIYKWEKNGILKPYLIQNIRRYKKDEIIQLLNESRKDT